MALRFIANRLKSIFLVFIGVLRRALCCFRRQRRNSDTPVPLTAIGVVQDGPSTDHGGGVEDNWDTWEDSGSGPSAVITERDSVQHQIHMYRQARQKSVDASGSEEEPNYFEAMAPKITRTPKVVLRKNDSSDLSGQVSSRLAATDDVAVMQSSELGDWEEGAASWEAEAGWETNAALREKREAERQRRLLEVQQKRQDRQMKHGSGPRGLGSRLS